MQVEPQRPFLEMRGIVKRFPGVLALDGVDLDVRPGEVHVLLGENGAGKSTLIKILSGVHLPDAGEILVEGAPAQIRRPRDAQALGISTIYQEFNLVPDMTVAENVFLGREPLSSRRLGLVDRRALVRRTREHLEDLKLDIPAQAVVRRLGIAQQQMVEIAKALSLKSRLIVMDEPTAVLSAREIDRLFGVIRDLRQRGVAIVYISHRLDEVKVLGDRATVLRDGALVRTVTVAETPVDELIRLMVGRELREKFPKVDVAIGEEVLRAEDLTRRGILHGVSLRLRRGEILGIAGLVGSRRTELARALFGADPLDSGRIVLRGKPARIDRPGRAIAEHMAFVPEDRKQHGILSSLSVKENMTLGSLRAFSRAGFLDLGRERKHAGEYATSLRIATPDLDRRVLYLSGGNQQKVVIAKGLSSRADIFLFDEPTRGIDVGAKVEVYRLMTELVQRGAAILMISSELPELLGMSDRILVMREGRVSGEFGRGEATEEAILDCALRGEAPSAGPREAPPP
jgi:ribose transport system ATP-binding protein